MNKQRPVKVLSRKSAPTSRKGRLFIVSAPSGAGKTTLCAELLKRMPRMVRSISYTTRSPRNNEKNGEDYYFISDDEFDRGIKQDRWAEWAEVHGSRYGTAADFIRSRLAIGIDVLLNIDVQGAGQLFARYPESIGIFILPPSMEELRRRLESRGGDSPEAVERRMAAAGREIAEKNRYHHVVVNDNLARAVEELVSIVQGYRRAPKQGDD
ncbi:MAG: guanylate kinase [Thermodesulfobacteriota bacterium]